MTAPNDSLDAVRGYADDYDLDLSWLDRRGEWGVRAEPDGHGLTLADIQVGSYGDAPDWSDNQTGKPRGSVSRPNAYRTGGYTVHTKSDIWLANAAMLYEEAP